MWKWKKELNWNLEHFIPTLGLAQQKSRSLNQKRFVFRGSVNKKKFACVLLNVELKVFRQEETSVLESRDRSKESRKAGKALQTAGANRKKCKSKVCLENTSSGKGTFGKPIGQLESRAVTRLPESHGLKVGFRSEKSRSQ